MASATRGEIAATLLNSLEQVGLMGPKLAQSRGTEEALAKQLAEYAGVPYEEWQLEFVAGQVKAAAEMEDLDRRLEGSAMTPSMQRIADASAVAEAVGSSEQDEPSQEKVHVPKRGALGKTVRLKSGRLAMAQDVEGKVLRALLAELGHVRAPILESVEEALDPARAARAVMSKYRPSTIRRYLASWQHFRKWHESGARQGQMPTGISLVDYLHVREDEGMGASIPLAVWRAVGWFEELANFDKDSRMLDHPMVKIVVQELTKKLEENAKPIKRAPRWMSCFVGAIEDVLVDRRQPPGRRICAFMKLVKVWASLRFSDVANIKSEHFKLYDGQIGGMLFKTKTTGAGKRVRELPIYIAPEAFIHHDNWMEIGCGLMRRANTSDGPYLFAEGIFENAATGHSPITYQEASAASSDLMENLSDESSKKLIPTGRERYWTEHSERATIASGLAAIGVHKTERDVLVTNGF